MAFRSNIKDREFDKFKQTPSVETAVRVCVDSDTPVPVYLTESTGTLEAVRVFGESNSVASGLEVIVFSYSVPVGKKLILNSISFSGTNIARYTVEVDGSTYDRAWTYFSGGLSGLLNYHVQGDGVFINSGQVITLKVLHNRPSTGDFFGSLLGAIQDD
jgi:hypothetical protein